MNYLGLLDSPLKNVRQCLTNYKMHMEKEGYIGIQ